MSKNLGLPRKQRKLIEESMRRVVEVHNPTWTWKNRPRSWIIIAFPRHAGVGEHMIVIGHTLHFEDREAHWAGI